MSGRHVMARALLLELGAGRHRPFYLKLVTPECQLVGNFFGYLIQVILCVSAFSALVIKKMTDKSPRTWKHWARDTSKQAFGSAVVHFANLAISYYLLDSSTYTDPCVFYEVSFLVDAFLGTILNIALLKLVEWIDRKYWRTGRLQSGNYGHPVSWLTWTIQSVEWVLITAVVKLVLLYGVLVPAISQLYAAGEWLNTPFQSNPHLELVMVMIVVPLVMNALVFWNTDAWLMDSTSEPLTAYELLDEQADEFVCCRPRLVTTPRASEKAKGSRRCCGVGGADADADACAQDVDASCDCMQADCCICQAPGNVVAVGATPNPNGAVPVVANGPAPAGGGAAPAVASVVIEPETVSRGLNGGAPAPLLRGGHSQAAASFSAAKLKAWVGFSSSSSSSSSSAGTHLFGASRSAKKLGGRHQDYHRL